MTSTLPTLVVLSLESTLFPFLIIHDTPFTRNNSQEVIDCDGDVFKYFPDVPVIFEKLQNASIKIAITTDCDKIFEKATQLISMFGWDKYISLKEKHTEHNDEHLINIHNKTQIPFNEMIYFANWYVNVNAGLKLGVFSVYVDPKNGLQMNLVKKAFKDYKKLKKEIMLESTQKTNITLSEKLEEKDKSGTDNHTQIGQKEA